MEKKSTPFFQGEKTSNCPKSPTPLVIHISSLICILFLLGVSIRRLIVSGCLLIGLFISIEPTIFNLYGSTSSHSDQSTVHRILWPMAFALGFVPVGIINVLVEKEMKKQDVCIICHH